jgi:hypothetical protein
MLSDLEIAQRLHKVWNSRTTFEEQRSHKHAGLQSPYQGARAPRQSVGHRQTRAPLAVSLCVRCFARRVCPART